MAWNGDDVCRFAQLTGGICLAMAPEFSSSTASSTRFGSSHTAGVNFVFADGSVRMICLGVNATNFMRLCARNDGGVVDLNNL